MTASQEPPEDTLEKLFRDGRTNAVLSWLLVGVLAVVFVESGLDLDYQWILFVGFVGIVVLIPPLAFREWQVMLPWELLVLATLPILVRGLLGGTVGTFATYLALAALALLVIVELDMFTTLSVNHWFAVVLVVLTTMAAVAAWTVFRWNADRMLGTAYLVDNEMLMMEWLYVTLAGIAAGLLFDGYFKRRDRRLWRAIRQRVGR
ncbi:hypothetical protein [Haloarcula marina]|uniref:hypothetical protein n=1 Tax=Haloarcula marina TaxID=2961574 RepID=UPI0020B788AD|nr:hypothetical protein [Halomicroarcula marina]